MTRWAGSWRRNRRYSATPSGPRISGRRSSRASAPRPAGAAPPIRAAPAPGRPIIPPVRPPNNKTDDDPPRERRGMKLEIPHLDHFPSLVAMFFDRAARGGEDPFLWRKADRAWQALSWRQVANQVSALAHNLRELGLREGDRVVLVKIGRASCRERVCQYV